MPNELYGSGTIPKISDTKRMLMVKEIQATNNSGGGGGPSFSTCVIGGVGPPVAAVPCPLSFYIQQPGPLFGFWIGDTVTGWGQIWAQGSA